MARSQITLQAEAHSRARRRASDLGISLTEYVRRLVACDLSLNDVAINTAAVFDLGVSGGSNIEQDKNAMVGKAFASKHKIPRRR